MNPALYVRLSLMMFGQYAIWGVWGPVLGDYLTGPAMKFSGTQTSLVYMTMAIASILAPLIAGQIADRYFPTQFYLAIVHLGGAGLLYLLSQSEAGTFWKFFALMMAYQILYAPTVGLTNSLAFHHLPHGERQFGPIRLWGAVAWILVGLAFGQWIKQFPENEQPQLLGQCLVWAALFSVFTAGYCLTLPHTPPSKEPSNPLAFMDALKLLKEPSFAVLTLISFLVATELQFYYVFALPYLGSLGIEKGYGVQILTLGQIVEVFVLLGIPWFVARFGIRATIVIGILAWPIRYGIFALGQPVWLVIASQGLHGLAYGFFFVGGQMYTDRVAGKDIRASAQSFMVLATAGVGMLLSSLIAGPVVDYFTERQPATGVLTKVEKASLTVAMRGDSGALDTFKIDANTKILLQTDEDETVKGENGVETKRPKTKEGKITDLKEQQRVNVVYQADKTALSIVVLRTPKVNWHYVFLVPVAITVLGALVFLAGFREKTKDQLDAEFGRAG